MHSVFIRARCDIIVQIVMLPTSEGTRGAGLCIVYL